jgi:hypothetical protein
MIDNQPNVPGRIKALESALLRLRGQLDAVTADLGSNPGNTRLIIQRVNVMKLVLLAQTEIDQLRSDQVQE